MRILNKSNLLIHQKFIICFIIFLFIPLIICGFLIFIRSSTMLIDKEKAIVKQKLYEACLRIDSYLKDIELFSYDISYNKKIQEVLVYYDPNRYFSPESEIREFSNLFGVKRFDQSKLFFLRLKT